MGCVTTEAQIESVTVSCMRATVTSARPHTERTAQSAMRLRTRGRERDTRDPTLGDHVGAPAAPRMRTEARANL